MSSSICEKLKKRRRNAKKRKVCCQNCTFNTANSISYEERSVSESNSTASRCYICGRIVGESSDGRRSDEIREHTVDDLTDSGVNSDQASLHDQPSFDSKRSMTTTRTSQEQLSNRTSFGGASNRASFGAL